MRINYRSQTKSCLLMAGFCVLAIGLGEQTANAQSDLLDAGTFYLHVVDSAGGAIAADSDPTTELFRRGTDPLAPLMLKDGVTPVTFGDFNKVDGEISIAARPGGGTDVVAELTGLLPGESYSFWAGYWPLPEGFPVGDHLAFGAISADGNDNWKVADAEGKLSINLIQPEGPMSLDGSAPAYAADPWITDLNGDPSLHGGYAVGVALHFGDYPQPPTPVPGPTETWALHSAVQFPTVPEPSSATLALLGGCALVGWCRRRGEL